MKDRALLEEQYKNARVALAVLRKIDGLMLSPKDDKDTINTNTRLFHRFAIANAECLVQKLQAELMPGKPWREREV